jgi:hypothetical protein
MGPDDGHSRATGGLTGESQPARAQAAVAAGVSPDPTPRAARILAWLVIVLAAVFVVWGVGWYGVSSEVRDRVWHDLLERPGGPMTFRFFLQPAMAAAAAIIDGLRDARTGRAPHFWAVVSNPAERMGRLRETLFSTARIILLGIVMDAIYQYIVLKRFYPVEALFIALFLAVVPYILIRGPANRIARWWMARGHANVTAAEEK